MRNEHGITKDGRKTPRPTHNWRQTHTNNESETTPVLRQNEQYASLVTAVKVTPFQHALVAFIVICQMAMSLVADKLFVEFLKVIFPKIETLLPGCGKTMRD